ncbi:MAG: plastocyanin/azurin family copper-binding protein [Actinomycetota bacterium]
MSHAADRRRPNPVWLLVVVAMAGLAVAGPVIMVRDQLADRAGAPSVAEGAQPAEGTAAGSAAGGTVRMAGLAFAPGTLTVAKGSTVVFDNDDTAPHTVTARSGGVDSGVLDPGKQFSVTVTDGFDYFCSIHPSMTAKIAVTG